MVVTAKSFVRYGEMNHLPAGSKTAEHEDGGFYRAILESIEQGYCTIEVAYDENETPTDYRFLEVSSSFERLTGIENGAGRWMREIAPDQDQFWFDAYGRVARSGEPERFENFSTPLDRWFSVYAFKIEGPARIAVLFDDITDRKRAESALRPSDEQFQALFDHAPLGVYLVDSDLVIRQVNPVALPAFGDIPGGPVGRDFDEVIHIIWDKAYADEVVGIFRHTLETGESHFTPERAEHRADRDIIEYYEWRLDRILLPGGRHGVVCYFRDVSAQVNARKEIEAQRESARASEERYRTLFEAIDSGFCIVQMIFDTDGRAIDYRFLQANPAFERQSGLVDAIGRRIREFAPDLEEHWFERYGRVALTGEPLRIEGEAAPLGRWFDINAFRVGEPEQRRVAVLFTDISARRNAQEAMRESEERQAFQLRLSDALASLSDPADIQAAAARLVAERLGVGWCYFNEFDDRGTHAIVLGDFHRDGLPSMVGLHDLSSERDFLDLMSSETMLNMPDLTSSEQFGAQAKAAYVALGMRSALGAPLLRRGRLAAVLLVADTKVRRWAQGDSELLRGVAERTWAAIERARAEAALSDSEQRQAFLLKLSDALRAEPSAEAIATRALQMLFEQMGLDRCYIGIYRLEEDRGEFPHQVCNDGLPPLPDHVRLSDFPKAFEIASHRTLVIDDVAEMEGLSDDDRSNLEGLGQGAIVTAAVRKGKNNPLWAIVASSIHPRAWTQSEVTLVEEVAERTWAAVERARSEAELRESEMRFRTLAESITDVFYITDLDRNQLVYLSPAYETVWGRSVESLLADLSSFGKTIHPDDLDIYLAGKAKQSTNEPVTTEYRIIRPDGQVRCIYDRSFPIAGQSGRRAAGVATDITERRRAVELQGTLLEELQHRVRNILALIQSVVQRTAETSESPEEYALHLEGRIGAMARTQAMLTRSPGRQVDLEDIVQEELLSVAAQEGQFWSEGPLVMLSPKAAEILTLAIHELATNAVKYGAFACPAGQLEIRWDVADRDGQDWLVFEWEESRVPKTTLLREGFGSELIKRKVPYELRGTGSLELAEGGIKAKIEFPLRPGSSILETGMPERPR